VLLAVLLVVLTLHLVHVGKFRPICRTFRAYPWRIAGISFALGNAGTLIARQKLRRFVLVLAHHESGCVQELARGRNSQGLGQDMLVRHARLGSFSYVTCNLLVDTLFNLFNIL
jgi:hypothetical protein